MMINKTVNVAYSCNEAYIQHTGISIISLLENNKDIKDLCIYFISKDVSEESIKILKAIVSDYTNSRFIVIPFEQICARLEISNVGRHIETIYAKLFFGNIKGVDKIYYLDSDVIINGSIIDVWNINLGSNFYGCVKITTKDYCKELGLFEKDDFFNDGVALVNVRSLREENMEEKFLAFIDKYKGNPPVLSEGTINVVCKNRIMAIKPKYNLSSGFLMFKNSDLRKIARQEDTFYTDKELEEAKADPVVIHYLTGWYKRPWEIGCTHPLKGYYEKYKAMSPWKNEPLKPKELPIKLRIIKTLYQIFPVDVVLFMRRCFQTIAVNEKKNNK